MDKEQIKAAWLSVFPLSHIHTQVGCFGDIFVRGFLFNHGEWNNGIWDNDPLHYEFTIEFDGIYTESTCSISTKPESPLLFSSREIMRKKTIKNCTIEKLEQRFMDVKNFIISHESNWNLRYAEKMKSKLAIYKCEYQDNTLVKQEKVTATARYAQSNGRLQRENVIINSYGNTAMQLSSVGMADEFDRLVAHQNNVLVARGENPQSGLMPEFQPKM